MAASDHTPGTLAPLVRALGGELYVGGRRALIPAPGHGAQDRSVSLLLKDGRVVAHTFGGADWREVLDDLRERGWIDAEHRLLAAGAPVAADVGAMPDPTRVERIAAAQRLWREAGPVAEGGPAALHIARRGIALAAATAGGALRAHSAAPAFAYRNSGPRRPALLAAVHDVSGAFSAVEITYLDSQGRKSLQARPARKVVGVLPAGCAVRLAPAAAAMTVGEGVFTTLSAMRRFARPGWALLSTSNLRRWAAPEDVRDVLIAGDRGPDGERSAGLLCRAMIASGRNAEVVLPPAGYGDWNDLDQEA